MFSKRGRVLDGPTGLIEEWLNSSKLYAKCLLENAKILFLYILNEVKLQTCMVGGGCHPKTPHQNEQ